LRANARELLARAERPIDDRAGVERLQLRADERAALSRLHMLELDDAPDVAVELDVHAVLELVRVDGLGHGSTAPLAVPLAGRGSLARASVCTDRSTQSKSKPPRKAT